MPTAMKTVWRAAREKADLTQEDIFLAWHKYPMPESIRDELASSSTAQRFDNGLGDISCFAKMYYAAILGVPLARLDKQAAEDCEEIAQRFEMLRRGSNRRKPSSTCNTASVAA